MKIDIAKYLYTTLLFSLAVCLYTTYTIGINKNRTDLKSILISILSYTFQAISVFISLLVLFGIINPSYPSTTYLNLILVLVLLTSSIIYAIKFYRLRKEEITLEKTLNLIDLNWVKENKKLIILPLILVVALVIILGMSGLVLALFLFVGFITHFLSIEWIIIISRNSFKFKRIKIKRAKIIKRELEKSTNIAAEKPKKKKKKKTKQKKSHS